MRSVYQPVSVSPPPSRMAAGPVPPRLGGDCAEVSASPIEPLAKASANSIDVLLAPLIERTRRAGSRLSCSPLGEFHHGRCLYRLPRFAFRGPPGGGSPIRLGIFAAIHGDEPEGNRFRDTPDAACRGDRRCPRRHFARVPAVSCPRRKSLSRAAAPASPSSPSARQLWVEDEARRSLKIIVLDATRGVENWLPRFSAF